MASEYVPVIAAICSGATGAAAALIAVYLSNKSNTARLQIQLDREAAADRAERMRDRGEELYRTIDKWMHNIFMYYLHHSGAMQGKYPLNRAFEMDGKLKVDDYDYGRIEMLIDVYFPATRAAYDAVVSNRTEANAIDADFINSYKDGHANGERFVGPFTEAHQLLEKAGEELKQQIIQAIRSVQ